MLTQMPVHAGSTNVTSAVSLTGGLTPSSAVNVAANTPVVVHVIVVAAMFGLAKLHDGLAVAQWMFGVLSGSVTTPNSCTAWFFTPKTSTPASTMGAVFGAFTVTSAVSLTGVLVPSDPVSVAAMIPPVVH